MFKENAPIFEQIKEHIINNIVKGIWKEGEMIPSVRVFATEMGVNPNTVMNALKDLQRDGIIENRRGIGNIIVTGTAERLKEKKKRSFIEVRVNELITEAKVIGVEKQELKEVIEEMWK